MGLPLEMTNRFWRISLVYFSGNFLHFFSSLFSMNFDKFLPQEFWEAVLCFLWPTLKHIWLEHRVWYYKEIVTVISSDLPSDGDARFTTVPLKSLSDQVWIIYQCFCLLKLFIVICGFSAKVTCAFLVYEKQWRNSQK